jgi:hypothetical protein
MRAFAYQGEVTQEPVAKMRAMTITGLCLFLDITLETWRTYRARKDISEVVTRAEQIIYDQKFSGAAADLLNSNIIARDLGLKDAHTTEHSGEVTTKDSSMTDVARRLAFIITKSMKENENG